MLRVLAGACASLSLYLSVLLEKGAIESLLMGGQLDV